MTLRRRRKAKTTVSDTDTSFYLSGPMTGLPNYNRDYFNSVAATLRAEQLIILNPADLSASEEDPSKPYEYYLREALRMQLASDATIFLPGWTRSRGAMREFSISVDLNHEMYLFSGIHNPQERNPDNIYFNDCTLIRMR